MRYFFGALVLFALLISPLAVGCSSKLSEKQTPVKATDDGGAESPVNNADNP